MTAIGERKWRSICKDLASAMQKGYNAAQPRWRANKGVILEEILRLKSSPSDAQKQIYPILLSEITQ